MVFAGSWNKDLEYINFPMEASQTHLSSYKKDSSIAVYFFPYSMTILHQSYCLKDLGCQCWVKWSWNGQRWSMRACCLRDQAN